MFQSLFYWIFLYNPNPSSIISFAIMFQSLFYWIFLYNSRLWKHNRPRQMVSILVLLDLPLQPIQRIAVRSRSMRFQSLFYWIFLYNSVRLSRGRSRPLRFNPCFIGSSSTTWGETPGDEQMSGFQYPCFIGSSSTTRSQRGGWSDANPVSILVLLDLPLQLPRVLGG